MLARKDLPSLDTILGTEDAEISQMNDRELDEWTAGWAAGTKNRLTGERAIRAREAQKHAWTGPIICSLIISVLALIVATIAIFRN